MQFLIKNSKIVQDTVGDVALFPKYTTQLMNLANQNAQGTRPKVVGQMSEFIVECPKVDYEQWVDWYSERMPQAVDEATERVYEMVKNLATAITLIDKALSASDLLRHSRHQTLNGLLLMNILIQYKFKNVPFTYVVVLVCGYLGEGLLDLNFYWLFYV